MLPFLECVFVEILQPKRRNILLGCVYRPPNTDVCAFNADFLCILDKINSGKQMNVCIAGDCNLDLLQTSHIDATNDLLNNLMSHSFNPVIRAPTRITTRSATILDNIYVNCSSSYDAAIVFSDISDHLPVAVHIDVYLDTKNEPKYLYKRFYSQEQIEAFNVELFDVDWTEVNQLSEPRFQRRPIISYSLRKT